MTNTIKSKNVEMIFNENPFHIEGIFILPDRTKVCAQGILNFFIRTRDALSDPVFLSEYEDVQSDDEKITFRLRDDSGEYSAFFNLTSSGNGIRLRIEVISPEPLWLIEWKLSGFDFDKIIIPALGGQEISGDMPDGSTLSYKYPFWWNAQFALGMRGDSGLLIHSQDSKPDLKLLRIGRENAGFSITYGFEAEAPLESGSLISEFYLTAVQGGWQNGVNLYRSWMEENFKPVEYRNHQGFPFLGGEYKFCPGIVGSKEKFYSGTYICSDD